MGGLGSVQERYKHGVCAGLLVVQALEKSCRGGHECSIVSLVCVM